MMATTTDNVNQEGNTEQCELQLGSRVGIRLSKDLHCEGTVVTIPITSKDDSPSSHFKCRIDYDDGETGWLDTSTTEYHILDNTNDKQFHHGNASKVASLSVGSRIELYWPQYEERAAATVTEITDWPHKPHFLVYDDGDTEWTNLLYRVFSISDRPVKKCRYRRRRESRKQVKVVAPLDAATAQQTDNDAAWTQNDPAPLQLSEQEHTSPQHPITKVQSTHSFKVQAASTVSADCSIKESSVSNRDEIKVTGVPIAAELASSGLDRVDKSMYDRVKRARTAPRTFENISAFSFDSTTKPRTVKRRRRSAPTKQSAKKKKTARKTIQKKTAGEVSRPPKLENSVAQIHSTYKPTETRSMDDPLPVCISEPSLTPHESNVDPVKARPGLLFTRMATTATSTMTCIPSLVFDMYARYSEDKANIMKK
jgi:hypothetical protein